MTGPSSERTADAEIVREGINSDSGEYTVQDEACAALDRLVARNQQLQEALINVTQVIDHVRANPDCATGDNTECPRCIADNALAADEDARDGAAT